MLHAGGSKGIRQTPRSEYRVAFLAIHRLLSMKLQRLAFICGSAVPGKDGVGDYCRILQRALRGKGVGSHIIALNDKTVESSEASPPDSLLLPASLSWPTRIGLAQERLRECRPDWISFQFVPFSFHPKGIIRREVGHLSALRDYGRWHAMMHELWLGIAQSESRKRKLSGWLQKRYVLQLLRELQPQPIHTSNSAYAHVLSRCGFPAKVLPIPSNIPIADLRSDTIKNPLLRKSIARSKESCIAVVFGTIHPQWNPMELLEKLVQELAAQGSRLRILFIGRSGPGAAAIRDRLPPGLASQIDIDLVGELDTSDISLCLQHASFGLSAMPLGLLGKSGTHAAMIEHGLPVIVTRDDWRLPDRPPAPPEDRLTFPFHPSRSFSLPEIQSAKRPPSSRAEAIVEQFLQDLEIAASP